MDIANRTKLQKEENSKKKETDEDSRETHRGKHNRGKQNWGLANRRHAEITGKPQRERTTWPNPVGPIFCVCSSERDNRVAIPQRELHVSNAKTYCMFIFPTSPPYHTKHNMGYHHVCIIYIYIIYYFAEIRN